MFSDSDGLVGGDFLQTKYDACSVMSLVSAGAAMAILFSYMIPIILYLLLSFWFYPMFPRLYIQMAVLFNLNF